jgi:succinate dehydrogenase / fumarate reductase cytochrome b subunit
LSELFQGKKVQTHATTTVTIPRSSVWGRYQFAVKRVFSLLGLFFGGYVIVHLVTNASLMAGVAVFQANVDRIHALGPMEWSLLFLPFLFHALVGWAIIAGGTPNLSSYPYSGNVRYVLQRVTAVILFFFVVGHVLHLHHLGAALGGGRFDPHRASSSLAVELQSALWIQLFYALGVLSAAFHLGNGIWTAGITWGLWTTPAAQRRANWISVAVGALVLVAGWTAIIAARRVEIPAAQQIEERMELENRRLRGEVVE